jgi:hypothetical protein
MFRLRSGSRAQFALGARSGEGSREAGLEAGQMRLEHCGQVGVVRGEFDQVS